MYRVLHQCPNCGHTYSCDGCKHGGRLHVRDKRCEPRIADYQGDLLDVSQPQCRGIHRYSRKRSHNSRQQREYTQGYIPRP